MPLKSGYSPESIGNNIALMMREGKPHAQAIAISLEHGRREFRKHFSDKKFPRYLEPISRKRSRKTNPVNKKRGFVIMVFGKGKKGYWTGLDWNTTLQRAHRYPSADQAKRVAEKLCLPAGYHIAVTS